MKKISIIFVILYVALLAVPAVTIPLFKADATAENRELSEFPKVKAEDGGFNKDYTDQLDVWIQEHIGFRQILVDANSRWQSALFGHSSEESIIVGADGWLYYADTAYDYLNIATISERNANNIGRTLQMVQDYTKEHGAAFCVTLIPNKNTLYGEAMPYYYIPTDSEGNLELVTGAMERYGVSYADMVKAFGEEDKVLYQTQDSHWTYEGALLGYRTIMDAMQVEYDAFSEMGFVERRDWDADLSRMLYADGAAKDVQLYPDYTFGYEIVSRETNVDAITLRTEHSDGNGNLVMFRDSFCNTMQVFFAEDAAAAVFSRAYPFPVNYVERYEADRCVIEIVERNIPNLAAKAPIMPAPEAQLDVSAKGMSGDAVTMFGRDHGSYVHVFGTVDEKYLGEEYEVYVLCNTGADVVAYAAFPIHEQELLGAENLGDNGFSVYLPDDDCTWEMEYSVVVYSNENYYASGSQRLQEIGE